MSDPATTPYLALMVCCDGEEIATVPMREGDEQFNREAERGALDRAYAIKDSNPQSVVSIVLAWDDDEVEAALECECGAAPFDSEESLQAHRQQWHPNSARILPPVGARVRLRHDVDRYPHFIAPAGALGTVVDIGDEQLFSVRLDAPLVGAEEWSNEVIWSISAGEDPTRSLEVIDPIWRTPTLSPDDAEALKQDRAYEIASADVVLPLIRDDAVAIADALGYLASVDEGEHTDYDGLLRLEALVRRYIEAEAVQS